MIKQFKNLIRRIKFYLKKADIKLSNDVSDNLEISTLRKEGVIFRKNSEMDDFGLKEIVNYCSKIINADDFNKKCEKNALLNTPSNLCLSIINDLKLFSYIEYLIFNFIYQCINFP